MPRSSSGGNHARYGHLQPRFGKPHEREGQREPLLRDLINIRILGRGELAPKLVIFARLRNSCCFVCRGSVSSEERQLFATMRNLPSPGHGARFSSRTRLARTTQEQPLPVRRRRSAPPAEEQPFAPARNLPSPGRAAAVLGAKKCTPEINTSEIIVDFQCHFPIEFHLCALMLSRSGLRGAPTPTAGRMPWERIAAAELPATFAFIITNRALRAHRITSHHIASHRIASQPSPAQPGPGPASMLPCLRTFTRMLKLVCNCRLCLLRLLQNWQW